MQPRPAQWPDLMFLPKMAKLGASGDGKLLAMGEGMQWGKSSITLTPLETQSKR